jgi:hypothetical protein
VELPSAHHKPLWKDLLRPSLYFKLNLSVRRLGRRRQLRFIKVTRQVMAETPLIDLFNRVDHN